jgi:hypothetical protein
MTYVDLGKYTFTTGMDITGFNVGNLTSVLDPAAIRVPNYELYRLLINTSAVPPPSGLPSVVQTSPFAVGSSATLLDINFTKNVTAGNTVVAAFATESIGGNDPGPTGITLGGSADHWGSIISAGNTNTASVFMWADPSAAGAAEAIAVAMSGGTIGPYWTSGVAWELEGMFATTSAAATVDTDGFVNTTAPTTAPQTTNNPTTVANDLQIGFGVGVAGSTFPIAGPGSPWTSTTTGPTQPGAGTWIGAVGSSNLAASKGSSGLYAPTSGVAAYWAALVASFLPSATAPVPIAFPFTVAVDGVTWDSEQTAAGVGYTYSLGQSPLYLKTGQTLQIFWNLPALTYATYSQLFNITGWFRYDPSLQP